jgi:hypothetical protein
MRDLAREGRKMKAEGRMGRMTDVPVLKPFRARPEGARKGLGGTPLLGEVRGRQTELEGGDGAVLEADRRCRLGAFDRATLGDSRFGANLGGVGDGSPEAHRQPLDEPPGDF